MSRIPFDMLRWAVSRFSAANIQYGCRTDNPWDEAVQLVLPSLYLPLDIGRHAHCAPRLSEKHRIVKRVIRRVNERYSRRLSGQQSVVLRA